jgi:hypothetical protein
MLSSQDHYTKFPPHEKNPVPCGAGVCTAPTPVIRSYQTVSKNTPSHDSGTLFFPVGP